jgi:hypothetical protein
LFLMVLTMTASSGGAATIGRTVPSTSWRWDDAAAGG